jgi:hypothetical protein
MSDDLVKALWKGVADVDRQQEAAARIEELEAENARLRAAYATPPADLTSPNPWKGEKEC